MCIVRCLCKNRKIHTLDMKTLHPSPPHPKHDSPCKYTDRLNTTAKLALPTSKLTLSAARTNSPNPLFSKGSGVWEEGQLWVLKKAKYGAQRSFGVALGPPTASHSPGEGREKGEAPPDQRFDRYIQHFGPIGVGFGVALSSQPPGEGIPGARPRGRGIRHPCINDLIAICSTWGCFGVGFSSQPPTEGEPGTP
jgi:hypothetical protein